MTRRLRGVIAAITTPITAEGEPDIERFLTWARHLLSSGCDGLNILGTTGEATSFSVDERRSIMLAAAEGLPTDRLMVGTGAAAVADAAHLTQIAASLGFAGAVVLPPFYYKPVSQDGLMRVFDALAEATVASPIGFYLYNFPALSGIVYTPEIVAGLRSRFGSRIAGLKDSSGDIPYARAIAGISSDLDVFPSNEANLLLARDGGPFAGCISATANVNATICADAYHRGGSDHLARAVAIRGLFDGLPLVPAVKKVVAHLLGDEAYARIKPPFVELAPEIGAQLCSAYDAAGPAVVWGSV